MKVIKINQVNYEFPDRWDEITISQASEFFDICKKIPKEVKELHDSWISGEFEYKELNSELITEFKTNVFKWFTKCPKEVITQTDPKSIIAAYDSFFDLMVLDIMNYAPTYTPDEIKGFYHNEVRYNFPESERVGMYSRKWHKITVQHFCEAAEMLDVSKKTNYYLIAYFVAILCNPEYNEHDIHKRAFEFKQLPMSIVWELLNHWNVFYNGIVNMYPSMFKGGKKSKPMRLGWSGFPLDIFNSGNYNVSLEQINQDSIYKWLRVQDRQQETFNRINEEKK